MYAVQTAESTKTIQTAQAQTNTTLTEQYWQRKADELKLGQFEDDVYGDQELVDARIIEANL